MLVRQLSWTIALCRARNRTQREPRKKNFRIWLVRELSRSPLSDAIPTATVCPAYDICHTISSFISYLAGISMQIYGIGWDLAGRARFHGKPCLAKFSADRTALISLNTILFASRSMKGGLAAKLVGRWAILLAWKSPFVSYIMTSTARHFRLTNGNRQSLKERTASRSHRKEMPKCANFRPNHRPPRELSRDQTGRAAS